MTVGLVIAGLVMAAIGMTVIATPNIRWPRRLALFISLSCIVLATVAPNGIIFTFCVFLAVTGAVMFYVPDR